MKKVLALLLTCSMVFSMAACRSEAENAPAEADGNKVYLITMDQMDQHWVTVDGGAKKAAAELGNVEYIWLAPDVKDDAKQIECINNAVAAGADAILLAANGPDAVTGALREAEAAGVKIIYVDSAANFPAVQTLATDNTAAGNTAGLEMLAALTKAGVTEGSIGIVNVNASTASVVNREAGFRAAFEGTDFEILETQYGDGDAARSKDIATNYITLGVVGIFGTNEGSTVGTGNAIKESGGAVCGVGFDKSDAILQLIDEGFLLCTMAQNPDVMGYEGMKTAGKVLAGEEIDVPNFDTGVSVLVKAASAEQALEGGTIYLITMDQMDQHWVTVDEGAKKAAAELGNVNYVWLAPDVKDDAKQIECINNAVAAGADAILLAANGPDAVTGALREAESAGVLIVYVDSAANYPAVQTLATDNTAAGHTAGLEMLAALTKAGVTEGSIGIVNVNASTASVVNREAGFRAAFEGTDFEILETQYGDGDAARSKDIATNYITLGVVGIFGANEGSTVGAGNAIKEAGGEVCGVGFDKSDAILQLINEGFLLCTMAQNPDVMGYEGLMTAVKALNGVDTGDDVYDTGVSVLTK